MSSPQSSPWGLSRVGSGNHPVQLGAPVLPIASAAQNHFGQCHRGGGAGQAANRGRGKLHPPDFISVGMQMHQTRSGGRLRVV